MYLIYERNIFFTDIFLFDSQLMFFTFPHWQRNDQSIILMSWLLTVRDRITTKNLKNALPKSYELISILMSDKYLIPYQSARFLAPRCVLYR